MKRSSVVEKENSRIKRQQGMSVITAILLVPLILILLVILVFGFYEGRKAYWDYRVREMCARDGGIRIYEIIELPAEYFNEWNQPKFYHPTKKEYALGKDYIYEVKTTHYRDKDPVISKREYRVYRRNDGKLLGESVIYGRGGGDIPGPWYPSSFSCPEKGGDIPLLIEIFHKVSKE